MKVLETSTGRTTTRRVIVNITKEHVERYGFDTGVEVEAVPRADGILIRRKRR